MISLEPFESIEKMLSSLEFVAWDRFTEEDFGETYHFSFYGWIARKQDNYKDFVLLTLDWGGTYGYDWSFVTSSAEYSKRISELVIGNDKDETPCRRIEKYFKIPNSIKLKTK